MSLFHNALKNLCRNLVGRRLLAGHEAFVAVSLGCGSPAGCGVVQPVGIDQLDVRAILNRNRNWDS